MHRHDHSPDPVETFLTDLGRAPVPPDLAPAVVARVREERQQGQFRRWSTLSALVGAVSVAVLVVAAALLVRASLVAGPSPAASSAPAVSPRSTPQRATARPTPGTTAGAGLRLTCADSGDATFPATALSAPVGAENGTTAAAAALRAFLADPPPDYNWPRAGWRELVGTSRVVLFAAPDPAAEPSAPLLFAKAENRDSRWEVMEYGECSPRVYVGRGLRAASWELGQRVSRTTREFTVLVDEQACASGRSPEGRIAPPRIVVDARSVTITFGVRPLPGGQDCQGVPPGRYRVRLPEPLGARELRDGGVFPPRVVKR